MTSQNRILLVEGETDRSFFCEVLNKLNLQVAVKVAPPRDLGGSHNTKEGVFNYLPTLLNQFPDGTLVNLAVVVDADSEPNGGYQRTLERVTRIVSPLRYSLSSEPIGGLIYKHEDGLGDFGLWIMPDNTQEGMLEDWLKQCIHPNEQALFNHAVSVVGELPFPPKFREIHKTKAEVSTWMAWQKKPGHGLYRAIEDNLLDTDSLLYQKLINWLRHIYSPDVA